MCLCAPNPAPNPASTSFNLQDTEADVSFPDDTFIDELDLDEIEKQLQNKENVASPPTPGFSCKDKSMHPVVVGLFKYIIYCV